MLVRNRLASYLRSLKSAAHSGVAGGCPMKPVSRFLTSVLLSALVAGPALAQRAEQIEISGFGSFTRYDRAFLLKNQFGGGVRIGYYTSNRIGIELEGGYQNPINVFGTQTATLSLASASLVLNYPAGKTNEFYILGGYTRLTFGDAAPYSFTDNGLHGAIGDRVFFGEHWALRLEGKAIWSPKTNYPGGTWGGQVIGSAGGSPLLIPPPGGNPTPADNHHTVLGGPGVVGRDRRPGPCRRSVQQGILLALGRRADQLRQAVGVRPVHSDVVGARLPARWHHAQPAGWDSLHVGHGEGRDHRAELSTRRKFSPRIFRTSLSL